MKIFSGDDSDGETPDTIPNSEVKPFSADDTVLFRDGKVGHRREFLSKPFRLLKT